MLEKKKKVKLKLQFTALLVQWKEKSKRRKRVKDGKKELPGLELDNEALNARTLGHTQRESEIKL